MPKKIVVFGSIVQDLISYTDRFPRPGESVRGLSFQAGAGGKGANQAVAASRLGADVVMIGRVGDDMFGESNLSTLKESGVDCSRVVKSKDNHTATATITVNNKGENNIVVTLGANMELGPSVADDNESEIAGADLVIGQAEIPELGNLRAFELAKKHGVRTFFNPAPGDANLDTRILKFVDIICTNENEAEFITGIAQNTLEDAKKAAEKMLTMGPQHVIITLGPKGYVLASARSGVENVNVKKVEAVDTTGAGDCMCGSLAALIVQGVDLPVAARVAANISTLSVTRKGTQSSYWRLDEIRQSHPDILPSNFSHIN